MKVTNQNVRPMRSTYTIHSTQNTMCIHTCIMHPFIIAKFIVLAHMHVMHTSLISPLKKEQTYNIRSDAADEVRMLFGHFLHQENNHSTVIILLRQKIILTSSAASDL